MVRIKEEPPLTTQALNVFFKTMHAELAKADMQPATKEDINIEVVGHTLGFIDVTRETNPMQTLPIFDAKDATPISLMPTTLSDLRKRMETFTTELIAHDEPTNEPTQALFKNIAEKSLRAAEKEMSKTGFRSR